METHEGLWKYHTGWRRFFAGILDSVILYFVALPFVLIHKLLLGSDDGGDIEFILGTVYFVGLTAIFGKTLGKHFCKVKVVSYPDEGRISLRQAVIRDIFPFVMAVLWLPMFFLWDESARGLTPLGIIGLAWAVLYGLAGLGWHILEIVTFLLDPQRRAFHDKIAGTIVVKTGTFAFQESGRPGAESP